MPVTVKNTSHNLAARAANQVLDFGERLGLLNDHLDPTRLLDEARDQTGLHDFGDEAFVEPLERIVECANGIGLSALGRQIARRTYLEAGMVRLKRHERFSNTPELADLPIDRPIFVLGFPRTGTTVLQNLLALHPDRRALEFWELSRPIAEHADPVRDARSRIQTTRQLLRLAYVTNPEMRVVHEIKTATPEECWPLFCPSFTVLNWDLGVGARSYGDWLMHHDMRTSYREYKQMLQLLVHQRPAQQLVLKCPEHLWFLDALLEVFPDACIVWTHRNPFNSLASYCSLISLQWRTMYGTIAPEAIGEHILRRFSQGVERAMEVRARVGEERFFDVDFLELVRDQAAMVGRITDHFGIDATDPAVLEAYLDTERSDGRGKHKYDAAMYGLRREEVLDRFAPYIRRFDIDCSASGGR